MPGVRQPAVLFPPVVATIVDYLNSLIAPVEARSKIPDPRPAKFVLVKRTGGPRDSIVTETAQVTIEAWADSSVDAEDLALTCRAHLQALAGFGSFYRVDEFSGPADLPDPQSHQSRWTWTIAVQQRGHLLTGS